MLDLSKDFDAVASKLFNSNDYIYAMNSLGYSVLFHGIDLKAIAASTSEYVKVKRMNKSSPDDDTDEVSRSDDIKDSAYIALDILAPRFPKYPLKGYPYLSLLLRCLKSWKCSSAGRHTLYLTSSNIQLNIFIYNHMDDLDELMRASSRLVIEHETNSGHLVGVDTIICCGNLDADVSFEKSDWPLRNGTCLWIERVCEGQKVNRMFLLSRTFGECDCQLEAMLSGINPEDEQTFRNIKSARARLMFPDRRIGVSKINEAEDGRADTTSTFYPFEKLYPELKSMVMKEVDETTYRNMARWSPFSDLCSSAREKHARAWRTVVRNDKDFSKLLALATPEKDAFLAGVGVRDLYNANVQVYNKPLGVILSWAFKLEYRLVEWPGLANRSSDSSYVKLFDPPIYLHFEADNNIRMMMDTTLDNYMEKSDKGLTIPVLYLKDGKYLLHEAEVEFTETKEKQIIYSFTVKGRTVRMSERSYVTPWHNRSNT